VQLELSSTYVHYSRKFSELSDVKAVPALFCLPTTFSSYIIPLSSLFLLFLKDALAVFLWLEMFLLCIIICSYKVAVPLLTLICMTTVLAAPFFTGYPSHASHGLCPCFISLL
jgi:hypothetical protein